MNEKEIETIIQTNSTDKLWREIVELRETSINEDWNEPYSIAESFDHLDHMSDEPHYQYLRTPCRKVNIALGVYVPMTQEQIDNTNVSHGKKWCFKLGGVAYQFSHHVL